MSGSIRAQTFIDLSSPGLKNGGWGSHLWLLTLIVWHQSLLLVFKELQKVNFFFFFPGRFHQIWCFVWYPGGLHFYFYFFPDGFMVLFDLCFFIYYNLVASQNAFTKSSQPNNFPQNTLIFSSLSQFIKHPLPKKHTWKRGSELRVRNPKLRENDLVLYYHPKTENKL